MATHCRLGGPIVAFLLILLGPILPMESSRAGEALDRILETRTVRIGYAPLPPLSYRLPDGRLTGEAPEVARRVFARMGVREIRAVEVEFAALIRDLKAGRFDVIASGMYVTPERCRQIAFSSPTYRAVNHLGMELAVRAGNPRDIHGYDDIARDPSVRLGVVAGTVDRSQAQAAGIRDSQLVIFPNVAAAARGVVTGRVDALAAAAPAVRAAVEREPKILEVAQPFRPAARQSGVPAEHGAFGFRKEDADLVEAFNRELRSFLGTPEHLDVVARFGLSAAELPEATTAELCAR
ncbi:ectoine/hydroxyectoine ABC transporter substrate-binding protein EhuB [Skermanella mucosa]|uniref:ectoine/hydroxyectoine ABC transporter substrate-binding protein EhuB n=1 Tax=Skermanella mucosa TaxID=1789672 RepID=UPI001E563A2B|nr:ectoine/hydroxyectoine ABC transporter substrate-binding protein EhuB [Skermanella mucosa]UEM19996.1 ectoine/hydroxyectoine ABC transporter substrate-binding protein EhuB [Skermanella mucosa]